MIKDDLREKLITCFQDTIEKSYAEDLGIQTARAIKTNRIYKEGFISEKTKGKYFAPVEVMATTTLGAAKKYAELGKVAILNFANPHNPGGGGHQGAVAQEESLCRSSNLYACLSAQNVFDDYYDYHRKCKDEFFSDRLIYTKNITVFKDDQLVPEMLPRYEWFNVDVITCSAPYIAKRKNTNSKVLYNVLKKRVKNIIEAARENEVEYLILGAFGCGAFKNPPEIVAKAFSDAFFEEKYERDFKEVIFAIKPKNDNTCPNYRAFKNYFGWRGVEARYQCTLLPQSPCVIKIPKLPEKERYSGNLRFSLWQPRNKYFEKQFSILGDSLSTLADYNPKEHSVFYEGSICGKSGVSSVDDTWWGKVISFFGGELLVNNSWSGSRVTKLADREDLFPSGCSNERTSSLHIDDVMPDVVIVYLGTNDWAFGAKTGEETHLMIDNEYDYFDNAYQCMIEKIKKNYPDCEIWCCTLSETYISTQPDFLFPHEYAGNHIEQYNKVIRDVAFRYDCKLADLYNFGIAYDSIDGSHANAEGMNSIATMIIRSMVDIDGQMVLDCAEGEHRYKIVEELTGVTKSICQKCGKTEVHYWLPEVDEADYYIEYDSEDEAIKKLLIDSTPTGCLSGASLDSGENLTILDLVNRPLLIPIEISNENNEFKIKAIVWMTKDGRGYMPVFSSQENVPLDMKHSYIRCKPEDYVPMLLENDFPVVLNPYNKKYLVLDREEIKRTLLPTLKNGTTGSLEGKQEDIIRDRFVGRIIDDRYEVLEILGAGGTYTTFLAKEIYSQKMFAMKVCDKMSKRYTERIRESIILEYYAIKELKHPAIPEVVEIIENEEGVFIIREYIRGMSLKQVLSLHGAQKENDVKKWCKQLCDVLGYLHSLSPPRIYRDIKPANIILKPDGDLCLIDFGIMRTYKKEKTGDTCIIGTKGYAAPEQYGSAQTDARTDIYALGMTMYHLITGLDPIDKDFMVRPIREVNSSLSQDLERIIAKCIEIDPRNRYQNCDELMKDLISAKGIKQLFLH